MNQISDTLNIGITFQMTLDSFLEEKHVIKSNNQQAYEEALHKLEDLKHYRNPKRKCSIAKEAIQICSDCIEGYIALGLYTQDVYERVNIYKEGMELATMNLGKDFFFKIEMLSMRKRRQSHYSILNSPMHVRSTKLVICGRLRHSFRKFYISILVITF